MQVPEEDPSLPRQIRVFISSTFRDMYAEREELVKQVFPQLRKLCEQRGAVWGDVDLRWGVTDEQVAEGRTLPICLTEVERCRPYFIGLLGERYGTAVDKIHPDVLAREPWLKDHLDRSLTELEILHGVLRNPDIAKHSFFYFRDPAYLDRLLAGANPADYQSENEDQAERLHALKARIRASGFPVRENYADPKALGQLVLADFTALIERLYPEGSQPNPLAQEAMEQDFYTASRERAYIRRQADFDELDRHVASESKPLVVVGEPGIGKSALLANWALTYRKSHPEELVLLHFVGATSSSGDWAAMVRRIMGEFERHLGVEEKVPDQPLVLRLAFEMALYKAAEKGRVVIVLDGLNQLEDREGAQELAWLPERVPSNVRLIVSTLPGKPLEEANRRQWPTLTVQPLTPVERHDLIQRYLQQFAKELKPEQVDRIVGSEQAANPLYLRVLLEELRQFGVYEELEQRIDYYLAAGSVPELYERILGRYEQDYERERSGLVRDTFSLIWASQRGLSESELLDVLGGEDGPLPKTLWLPLIYAAADSLIDRGGILTFSHDHLRQAVQGKYVPERKDQLEMRRRLAAFFAPRDESPRKVQELLWLHEQCGAWDLLATLLGTPDFLKAALALNKYRVQACWVSIERSSNQTSLGTYAATLASPETNSKHALQVTRLIDSLGHTEQALKMIEKLVEHCRQDAGPVIAKLQKGGLRAIQADLVKEYLPRAMENKGNSPNSSVAPDDEREAELALWAIFTGVGKHLNLLAPLTILESATVHPAGR